MTHPQEFANKLGVAFNSPVLKTIGQSGCCALCALYVVNPYLPDLDALVTVAGEIGKGLDADCTVNWHPFIKNVFGKEITIKFIDIDGLDDIKHAKGKLIVRFDYASKSHWVVCEKGKIVFNPLEHSNCVEKGKARAARIMEIS